MKSAQVFDEPRQGPGQMLVIGQRNVPPHLRRSRGNSRRIAKAGGAKFDLRFGQLGIQHQIGKRGSNQRRRQRASRERNRARLLTRERLVERRAVAIDDYGGRTARFVEQTGRQRTHSDPGRQQHEGRDSRERFLHSLTASLRWCPLPSVQTPQARTSPRLVRARFGTCRRSWRGRCS